MDTPKKQEPTGLLILTLRKQKDKHSYMYKKVMSQELSNCLLRWLTVV